MKLNNMAVAKYLSEQFDLLTDDHLREIAKKLNLRSNVLIRNYKNFSKLKKILNEFKQKNEIQHPIYNI